MNKVCSKCEIEKPLEDFYFRKDKGYHKKQCKKCCLEMDKINRIKNSELIKIRVKNHSQKPEVKERRKKYSIEYREKNIEIIKIKNKIYRDENKKSISEWHKNNYLKNFEKEKERKDKYRKENKDKIKIYQRNLRKKRLKNDPEYKLKSYMLSQFTRELKKKNISKKERMFRMTGFKYSDYINHLKNDILWNDFCNNKDIHTDHIIPISSYDFNNPEDIKKCWNPLNLRLLNGFENKSKHNKIDFNLIKKYNINNLLPEKLKNAV